jgi:histone H3/H4
MVAKDATFLISLATEEFIRRLAVAVHNVATKENRTTMRVSDIVMVSKRIDEFLFLEGTRISVCFMLRF